MRLLVLALTLALVGAPASAEAKPSTKSSTKDTKKTAKKTAKNDSKKAKGKDKKKKKKTAMKSREVKKCKMVTKKGKTRKRCKWVPRFEGFGVGRASLRTDPLPRPTGEVAFEPNNKPGVIFRGNIYTAEGDYDDAVLAELDRGFVCKRTGDLRAVDPRLYETLSTIYEHFGKKTIVLVSGHRLQTKESGRHHHAAAMDIYIPGVSNRELYDFAESLDTGGMGIGLYPRSGFIHVDWRAPGSPSYRWTDWYGGMAARAKKARDAAKKKKSAAKKKPRSNS